MTETCSEFNDGSGHLVLRLSQVLRRLGARRAASRATTPRTSTHLHGQLGSGPAHRSRNGRLARDEGLKPGAWTVYNDGMVREPGSAGCPELSPARAAALAARRHDGSSSRRREAQAGIGQRRGGGSGSTSEVHKDAMEGLRPAYPPATPERSRARPLHAPRLPTPIFPAADRCCSELLLRADPRQCRAAGRHSGLQHFHRDPGRPSNGLRRLRPPADGSPTRLYRPAGTPLRPCLRRVTGGFRHR